MRMRAATTVTRVWHPPPCIPSILKFKLSPVASHALASFLGARCFAASAGRSPPPTGPPAAARLGAGRVQQTNSSAAAPAKAAVPPLTYTPPTPTQLLKLHQRLCQPYAANASSKPARANAAGECRVLALDVGDRFVGVAVSDGGSGAVGIASLSSTGNRRATPLLTLQRKELVATGAVVQPLSPHSHHQRRPTREHTELRGAASSARRVLRPRPIADVAAEVRGLLQQHRCVGLVVGMPLTMAHTLDEQCEKTLAFVAQLQAALLSTPAATPAARASASSQLPPFQMPQLLFWDERLSSADARMQLQRASGLRSRSRAMAERTDSVAAAVILQELLDRMHLHVRSSGSSHER